MEDFDDISNVLDDLADFDMTSFSAPAPTPVVVTPAVVQAPAPVAAAPIADMDFDMDFGMDFAPPGATGAASTPDTVGLDDASLSLNDIIDNLDFGLDEPAPAPKPASAGRGGPQVMNMQPTNGGQMMGGRGGPQVMNMQPANMQGGRGQMGGRGGPQVMNMQPANMQQGSPVMGRGGPQVMNMQPANMQQGGRGGQMMGGPMGGRGGPQVMNMQPGNMQQGGPQVMNMQPANGGQMMGGRGGPQVMNMQPANMGPGGSPMRGGPQVMNMQPGNMQQGGPQVMNMQPGNGPQVMNMQPGNGPQVMNMQPANMGPGGSPMRGGPQVMNMQPGNMPQGGPQVMNMQPGNGPQVMNMQPGNGPQVMNMQPRNGPQVMNMQPGNGPQVMNMQPGNGPQVMNMQPGNMKPAAPVGPTGHPMAQVATEDEEEWPEPEKKAIEVRELNPDRPKMILTLLLADRSTKKVFVTDDFLVKDLKDMFASKLLLWQTDFFELCVKDTKEDANRWLDPKKSLLDEAIADQTEVMMKIKYFKTPKKLVDPQAIRLYYLDVKSSVTDGSYPCSEKLAVKLAAHQVQLTYGNYVPTKHQPGFLGDAIKDYLPREIISMNEPRYVESRIFQLHRDLVGKSNEEVMESYVELAQQIQTYGSSIFLVKEKLGRAKRVAIAEDGVLISTDENPKKFDFFSFKDLGGWQKTSDGFSIEVVTPAPRLLEFEATEFKTDSIIELMCGYYLFLLGINTGDLPLVSLPMQPADLPNPRMFHKPNTALKRNLQDQTQTRLELFKDELATLAKKRDVPMNMKLLTQTDNAIDQDLVLDELDLSRSNLVPAELRIFVDAVAKAFEYMPKEDEFFEDNMTLARLDLSSNPVIKGGDVDALGRVFCTDGWTLKHLVLKNIGLDAKAATMMNGYLAKNDFLESIDLEDNDLKQKGVAAILKPLKGQERCHSFNFNGNGMAGTSGYFLAQVVAKNSSITELRVGGNKFDTKQLGYLLEGLVLNKTLQVLDISNCGITTESGRAILGWLNSHKTLRTLYIGNNNLGSTWGNALVKILNSGCSVTSLDVSKNGLGSKATRGILAAIKEHRAVRELNLSGNSIDKKGGQMLCECLGSRSVNLRTLSITGCGLPRSCMTELGKNLQQNTTLRSFDASGNEIKDAEGAKAWGDAIRSTQTLEVLHLSGCSLAGEVFGPIANGLKDNKSLEKFYLDGNSKLGKTSFHIMGDALAGNRKLRFLSCRGIGADPANFEEFLHRVEGQNFTLRELDLSENSALGKVNWSAQLKKVSFPVTL